MVNAVGVVSIDWDAQFNPVWASPARLEEASEGSGGPSPGPSPLESESRQAMAGERGKTRTILKRQLETREKLWPGIDNDRLWYRKDRDGFITMPRLMPLIMGIMDDLSGKGFPVGQTYLEMWCRLYDEGFLTLNRPEEMAFYAGFSGQRAVRTWRDRVRRLHELGFIDIKSGPMGEFSYVLFWNPYHVLRRHRDAGSIQDAKWRALEVRASEIGATDIDDFAPKPKETFSADLDDEIPF